MTKERKEETNPAIKQAKEVTTNKSSSTSSLYQEEEMMVQSPEKEEADARITYTRPEVSLNRKKKMKKKIRMKAQEGTGHLEEENGDDTQKEDFQELEDSLGDVFEDTERSPDAPPLGGASPGMDGSILLTHPELTTLSEVKASRWHGPEADRASLETKRLEDPGGGTRDLAKLEDPQHLQDAPPLVGAPPGMDGSSTPSTPKLTALSEVASQHHDGQEAERASPQSREDHGGEVQRAEAENPAEKAGDSENLQDAPPSVGASPGTEGSIASSPHELTTFLKVEAQKQDGPPTQIEILEHGRLEGQKGVTQDQRQD